MAVRIRMKRMGRKHRSFFRICATDSRAPRDGRVIEELGTYDPHVPDTDARTTINGERLEYWLSVGALPSEKVAILIKKYGPEGIRAAEQQAAKARLVRPQGDSRSGRADIRAPAEERKGPGAVAAHPDARPGCRNGSSRSCRT